MKNSHERLNTRFGLAEKSISKLKYRSNAIIQFGEQKEKWIKKKWPETQRTSLSTETYT